MNKYKTATIVLVIILLLGVGYFRYNYLNDKKVEVYNQGVADGQLGFYNQLMFNLQQNENRFITLPIFQNNQTYQVNFYPEEQ